jgi:hypothetical protein
VVFLAIRTQIHKKYEIDWDSFIHSIISGFGSAICIHLNIFAAVPLTGYPGKFHSSFPSSIFGWSLVQPHFHSYTFIVVSAHRTPGVTARMSWAFD